jgi:hypothetical protein
LIAVAWNHANSRARADLAIGRHAQANPLSIAWSGRRWVAPATLCGMKRSPPLQGPQCHPWCLPDASCCNRNRNEVPTQMAPPRATREGSFAKLRSANGLRIRGAEYGSRGDAQQCDEGSGLRRRKNVSTAARDERAGFVTWERRSLAQGPRLHTQLDREKPPRLAGRKLLDAEDCLLWREPGRGRPADRSRGSEPAVEQHGVGGNQLQHSAV